jgi:hypothetical protein
MSIPVTGRHLCSPFVGLGWFGPILNGMTSKQDLEHLYLSATYIVHDADDELTIRLGRGNAELDSLLKKAGAASWAFLTAYNPNSRPTDQHLNEESQSKLIDQLKLRGLRYLHGYGTGEEWEPEPSIFILDIQREAAVEMGREFGQSAILYGQKHGEPELVWCDAA